MAKKSGKYGNIIDKLENEVNGFAREGKAKKNCGCVLPS